jgi:hypothetical protein
MKVNLHVPIPQLKINLAVLRVMQTTCFGCSINSRCCTRIKPDLDIPRIDANPAKVYGYLAAIFANFHPGAGEIMLKTETAARHGQYKCNTGRLSHKLSMAPLFVALAYWLADERFRNTSQQNNYPVCISRVVRRIALPH